MAPGQKSSAPKPVRSSGQGRQSDWIGMKNMTGKRCDQLHVTKELLDHSKLIFNHLPKAGGSSLYQFFQELFGEGRVFRFWSRTVTAETKTMESLTEDEKTKFKVFQGHFKYGYHKLFQQKCLYFGIMRDPIDRMISNYYYTREKGREDRKQHALSVDLETFVEGIIAESGKYFGAAQVGFLTGQSDVKVAKRIIDTEYLACCTTDQLNDCQALLARLYGRPDLAPKRVNVTNSDDKAHHARAALRERYDDFFRRDYELLNYVRKRFDTHYSKLDALLEV